MSQLTTRESPECLKNCIASYIGVVTGYVTDLSMLDRIGCQITVLRFNTLGGVTMAELGVTTQAVASRLRRNTETVVVTTLPETRPPERIVYKLVVYEREGRNRPAGLRATVRRRIHETPGQFADAVAVYNTCTHPITPPSRSLYSSRVRL